MKISVKKVLSKIFKKYIRYTRNNKRLKRKKNDGIEEGYYIENTHPEIATKEIFNRVQEEQDKRARQKSKTKEQD